MTSCSRCGRVNQDAARFCDACGADLSSAAAPPAPPLHPQTSGMAIASLIFGCLFFIFPAAIVAIILGHISGAQIRKSAGQLKGAGMSLAGLILGYAGVAFIPFILIIAAIAIPNLLRSRIATDEASAVGSLRTISTACVNYSNIHHGFPPALATLGPPSAGSSGSDGAANLIDATLASGTKHGYVFSYEATGLHDGVADGFTVSADPVTENTTGVRHFLVDETGVIRFAERGPASRDSTPLR